VAASPKYIIRRQFNQHLAWSGINNIHPYITGHIDEGEGVKSLIKWYGDGSFGPGEVLSIAVVAIASVMILIIPSFNHWHRGCNNNILRERMCHCKKGSPETHKHTKELGSQDIPYCQ